MKSVHERSWNWNSALPVSKPAGGPSSISAGRKGSSAPIVGPRVLADDPRGRWLCKGCRYQDPGDSGNAFP